MRILIATGIYPPDIGGPAQYTVSIEKEFRNQGHTVLVKHYTKIERILPIGIRHIYFALKSFLTYLRADQVLVLDTFSVAFPIYILSLLTGKRYTIRTGGDFLWENYVERTRKDVLLRNFYSQETGNLTGKERIIFWLTKKIVQRAEYMVFSTTWQKNIWLPVYGIDERKTRLVENYYNVVSEAKTPSTPEDESKVFMLGCRELYWKNKKMAIRVLERLQRDFPRLQIEIDDKTYPHAEYIERMKKAYATVLVSLGDISPNMMLDSVRAGTPFVLTKENGITERLQGLGVFVEPLHEEDIYQKIVSLLNPEIYADCKKRIKNYAFIHTWKEIAAEFIQIWQR
jgi:glycosyltransferase involved in cell wall biosynthesis